ncbi:hypothetical protein [Thalassobacillus devorans]|uniref:hypothetical protein n=1 Tax=Thalassobacillus devorans TaxID=279813 RepID=UPI00048E077B|nr:hypothetical protein [Thalassobacillus devorans]
MQANNSNGGQGELLCISTEKVYDWIVNEKEINETVTAEFQENFQPCNPSGQQEIVNVTCEVTDVTITEPDPTTRVDRTFMIDGSEVTLQEVTLEKTVTLTVTVTLDPMGQGRDLETQTSEEIELTRMERVILCAPEGTIVTGTSTQDTECMVTSFSCTGVQNNELSVSVSLIVCQSIVVTFPVILELTADFCEPRDVLPLPVCPTPSIPPQCPVLFPDTGNGNGNGNDDC